MLLCLGNSYSAIFVLNRLQCSGNPSQAADLNIGARKCLKTEYFIDFVTDFFS